MPLIYNKNPIDQSFNIWISQFPESFHWCDMARFYVFVKTVCRYSRSKEPKDCQWLKDKIKSSGKFMSDDDILTYCEKFTELQEFHKTPHVRTVEFRPD